jgi:hypothetical protein
MKKLNYYSLAVLAMLLLPLSSHAQDELEVTLEAVPANASADSAIHDIKLPEGADPQAHESAAFGLDTANKARRLREEMQHEFGEGVSDAARERSRERIENIPAGRP